MADRKFQFVRRQGLNTGGSSGPPTWGAVVGTLSDQADLTAALANKVNVGDDPYPQVVNHAALPSAATNAGEIYIVQNTTGFIGLRKLAGLWRSDGAAWGYLGLYGRNASEIVNVPGPGSSATDVQAAIDDIGGRSTDGWAEGSTNLYFTAARVRSTLLTGISLASTAVVSATDTVLAALGQLQAQITALTTTVGTKLNSSAVSTFGLTLIDDANNTAARNTLGLGTLATQNGTFSGTSSGTNTGDQTSIVGISGTKAQFNAAVSDGDILYVGDITQYTDENARDALGAALVAGANVTITVNDAGDTITIAASGGGGGGSPGGSTTQIQYNNAGAFDGAARVLIDASEHLVVDEYADFIAPAADPAAPAAGAARKVIKNIAGRMLAALWGSDGWYHTLQPHIGRNRIAKWQAAGNSTTITADGAAALTAIGTATAATVAVTNIYTLMRRLEYLVTAAATTAVAGYRYTGQLWCRGALTSKGGFSYMCQWGPATGVTTATARAFVGMRNLTSAHTDVEPSTQVNIIGMGWDAADTNIQIMHNDAAGAATKVDLGASFPVPAADRTKMYELALTASPYATGKVGWRVEDLGTGAVATGSITTDLPAAATLLAPSGYCSVGGTSSVVGLALAQLYIESEF
ncbi:MAG: hypothetical protein ACRCWJ_15175 [Casimicrobium sp.]